MKKILVMFLILLSATMAYTATLKWGASTGVIDGYKVYYNDKSKLVAETEIDIVNLGLVPGIPYDIFVTVYNVMGESDHSNEITYTLVSFVPGKNPSAVIRIPGPVTIIVE